MTTNDPAEIAAEMLRERLPGFASKIDGTRDMLTIVGYLKVGQEIAGEAIREAVHYPVLWPIFEHGSVSASLRNMRDTLETDDMRAMREARMREEIKHDVEPVVAHIVDSVQRFAIEAVGLEARIEAEKAEARERGAREGFADGKLAGKREGRAELLREWRAAIEVYGLWDRSDDE